MENRTNDEDRAIILSSSFELEEYLSSTVILWRLKGSIPPLSPGNLILAMQRTNPPKDQESVQAIDHIQSIINLRKAAWEKKIKAELPMRLRQWSSLVDEILEYGRIDSSYQYNVRVRVILTLLLDTVAFPDVKLREKLQKIDERLDTVVSSDGFIWNPEIEQNFPRERYPFLYLTSKGEGK